MLKTPLQRIVYGLGIVLALVVTWWAPAVTDFLFVPRPMAPAYKTYGLTPGKSVHVISQELTTLGVINRPIFFKRFAWLMGQSKRLQAGVYHFTPQDTAPRILFKLSDGRIATYHFTLVEGWTFKQVLRALEQQETLQHLLPPSKNKPLFRAKLKKLLGPALKKIVPGQGSLEGVFFPDTYQYTSASSDVALLKKSLAMMAARLGKLWEQRAEGLPYQTPYEALIAASLVEKETGYSSERAQIAGVIVRRLKKHMPLQIDSTVIYGLGDKFQGNLQTKHLSTKTPYNTYKRLGLPPTPIAMPSESSLYAALHPDTGNALYFVSRGNGTHIFSANLEDHQRAVATFQLHCGQGKLPVKSYLCRKFKGVP